MGGSGGGDISGNQSQRLSKGRLPSVGWCQWVKLFFFFIFGKNKMIICSMKVTKMIKNALFFFYPDSSIISILSHFLSLYVNTCFSFSWTFENKLHTSWFFTLRQFYVNFLRKVTVFYIAIVWSSTSVNLTQ